MGVYGCMLVRLGWLYGGVWVYVGETWVVYMGVYGCMLVRLGWLYFGETWVFIWVYGCMGETWVYVWVYG